MTPQRVQRKRTKGWRMPENTVYVGRGSKWGNPYRVIDGQRGPAVAAFETMLMRAPMNEAGQIIYQTIREELAGKNLACWCPLEYFDGSKSPCHADVLLEIANQAGQN
jgi:hypothetical protein